MNRVTSAKTLGTACTKVNGGTLNWGESFTIDAWGNLTGKTTTLCSAESLDTSSSPFNQLAAATYDSAGNAYVYNGASYLFDAEGRMTSAAGTAYVYDGAGQRVSKPGKLYWRGTGSDPLAETSATDTNPTRYIFFGGKRIARIDPGATTPKYYVSDNLGSTADVTDYLGNVLSESEFYPYGGEQQVVANDTNDYKFTGKERDAESGNDYFGARYYASTLGRFLSPDWDAKPTAVPYATFGDPQTLNLYAYVENAPLNRVDADGHVAQAGSGGNQWLGFDEGPCAGGWSLECINQTNTDNAGSEEQIEEESAEAADTAGEAAEAAETGTAQAQQQSSNGASTIVSVSATSAAPAAALGAVIGEAIDPAGGGVVGALLGSTVGVGVGVSYVPSTDSWYAGPTVTFSPIILSGTGASANAVIVPKGQDPNSIANGPSFSFTLQPTPLTGTTVTKSPGSGPPVAGPSVGTKVPIAYGASYNFNITPAVRAVRSFVNNAVSTVRSWF
jgi:RHS repeat-associated protein